MLKALYNIDKTNHKHDKRIVYIHVYHNKERISVFKTPNLTSEF